MKHLLGGTEHNSHLGQLGDAEAHAKSQKNGALQSNSSSFIDTDEGAVIAEFYRGDVSGFSGQLEDETLSSTSPKTKLSP
jgi:hypothetical protein